MIINKGLYFWAYQLQKYKRSGIEVTFNILSFLWLLFGTVISFWLINMAIYNIEPTQFNFTSNESGLSIFVYSMSTLFFNEGAGITPAGSAALISRVAAGFFGTVFIFTIVANSIAIYRRGKNNQALDDIVASLKQRAHQQNRDFKSEYSLTVDEARIKLEQLGTGLYAFVRIINSAIPSDFMDNNEEKNVDKYPKKS